MFIAHGSDEETDVRCVRCEKRRRSASKQMSHQSPTFGVIRRSARGRPYFVHISRTKIDDRWRGLRTFASTSVAGGLVKFSPCRLCGHTPDPARVSDLAASTAAATDAIYR